MRGRAFHQTQATQKKMTNEMLGVFAFTKWLHRKNRRVHDDMRLIYS